MAPDKGAIQFSSAHLCELESTTTAVLILSRFMVHCSARPMSQESDICSEPSASTAPVFMTLGSSVALTHKMVAARTLQLKKWAAVLCVATLPVTFLLSDIGTVSFILLLVFVRNQPAQQKEVPWTAACLPLSLRKSASCCL